MGRLTNIQGVCLVTVEQWQPSSEQKRQWDEDGYFMLRHVVPNDIAFELRGVIKNELLEPEPGGRPDADPMDPMGGDTPADRAARFRKLGSFCATGSMAPYLAYLSRRGHAAGGAPLSGR